MHPLAQRLSDSFTYTVLPEPGSVFFGALSMTLLLTPRRGRSPG